MASISTLSYQPIQIDDNFKATAFRVIQLDSDEKVHYTDQAAQGLPFFRFVVVKTGCCHSGDLRRYLIYQSPLDLVLAVVARGTNLPHTGVIFGLGQTRDGATEDFYTHPLEVYGYHLEYPTRPESHIRQMFGLA